MPQPPEHKVNSTCPKNKGLTQRIVATRLLYRLQYPLAPIQVVCKGFILAHIMIALWTNPLSLSAMKVQPT
ncbi:hypothetical protein CC2G_006723 [Coprinopsis cinerea AmutBmut pab1-1]|nr:hypothetical protein CC2G_006723 [Coprinopsis cinerea AmutBmut pab1-1]